jgi:dihydroxyacetone kinase
VLWGAALAAVGVRLGDQGKPDGATVSSAVRAGYDALTSLGKAAPGDKTMLDALLPFAVHLDASLATGAPLAEAWASAAAVAQDAADATKNLRPRVGRARPLAEKSLGTPDAGAISMALCLRVVGEVLGSE